MPWIENVSLENIKKGFHFDPGENSMLIQILDPDMEFPEPHVKFKEIHKFHFLDIEKDGSTNNGDGEWTDMSQFAITKKQADDLAMLLKHALDNCMNVIVHCHAGVCRSGAVVEAGIIMGFSDTEVFRSPNLLVKHRILESLGLIWDFAAKKS